VLFPIFLTFPPFECRVSDKRFIIINDICGIRLGIGFAALWLIMPTILVVEDDRRGRYLVCEVLRREGYQVEEARDGAEALEVIRTKRIDLVITDLVMPKLNGFKFVEQLRLINPRMPIIFTTGYLSVITGKTLLQDIAEVLPKPFEFDALRSTVKRLLASSAASRA
jgi:CheY-like chemotaxis protein